MLCEVLATDVYRCFLMVERRESSCSDSEALSDFVGFVLDGDNGMVGLRKSHFENAKRLCPALYF